MNVRGTYSFTIALARNTPSCASNVKEYQKLRETRSRSAGSNVRNEHKSSLPFKSVECRKLRERLTQSSRPLLQPILCSLTTKPERGRGGKVSPARAPPQMTHGNTGVLENDALGVPRSELRALTHTHTHTQSGTAAVSLFREVSPRDRGRTLPTPPPTPPHRFVAPLSQNTT